jgi:hypothetical protein
MISIRVTYRYGAKGQKPTTTRSNEGLMVEAKTESAVMAALRRTHPNYGEILILEIR